MTLGKPAAATMRAWIVESPGAAPAPGMRPVPAPGAGEVRLRVTAAALNHADILMIDGRYQDMPPYPLVPGLEMAGVVDAVGPGVTGHAPGDRVAAVAGHGGLAEMAVVPAARLLRLPNTMDDATAAAFQIAYGTAHLALGRRARLRAGETLCVLGAAGGVGLTAVEVGKAIGARVVAVARGQDRLAVAERAGADALIDGARGPDDIAGALRAAGPFDVVFDPVGGSSGEAAQRALRPEGRHLLIGFASGALPRLRPNHLMVKNLDVLGVYWGAYFGFDPGALVESLGELVAWHGAGRIRPHIGHRYPFDRADAALRRLRNRAATGKIVINFPA